MKKNVAILFGFFLFAVIMVLVFGWILPAALQAFLYNHYLRSFVLLAVFSWLVLRKRFTWKNNIAYMIAIFALAGMVIDTAGNPVYNKPLQWLVSPFGELQVIQEVDHYAPGRYVISGGLTIVKPDGETAGLNQALLFLYRFVQYVITYCIVGTLLAALAAKLPERVPMRSDAVQEELPADLEQRVADEMKRREEDSIRRRVLPEEIQAAARTLKQDGDMIRAIKLVREHTDLSLGEAKKLVEDL